MDGRYVAYYRVSTKKQGNSGLGLDAQQKAVADYLNGGNWQLLGSYTDVESGGDDARPQLAQAMDHAKKAKATLLIAKLDRLSRRVSFVSRLMESGVTFVAVDNPHATKLVIHMMVVMAEEERRLTSERTKAALAAAKRRGVKLGNPRLSDARKLAAATRQLTADTFAEKVIPAIRQIRKEGHTTLRAIAECLNDRGVRTRRGNDWTAVAVNRVLERV